MLKFAGPKKWTPTGYADKFPKSENIEKSEQQSHYLENEER